MQELLALEERIGNVNTGLSERTIIDCLRTRTHTSCTTLSDHDESSEMDQKSICVVCQVYTIETPWPHLESIVFTVFSFYINVRKTLSTTYSSENSITKLNQRKKKGKCNHLKNPLIEMKSVFSTRKLR